MEEIERLKKAYEEQLEINRLARLEIEKEEEQRKGEDSIIRSEVKPIEEPWKGKFNLMNLNEDPFLTGKIRHTFKKGENTIGKTDKDEMPDIVIGGVGVLRNHCKISFDGTNVVLVPNPDPNVAKVFVNGKLITEPTKLKHSDRILFGSHNYFLLNDPSNQENSSIDWDYANKEVIQDQLNAITSNQDELLQAKLKEMEEKYEAERKVADEEAKKLIEERRLELEKEYKEKMEQLQKQGGSEGELKKLKEEMKKKGEAVEEDIQKKSAKELNKKKKMRDQTESRMKNQKELEEKLAQAIPKINEVNEMCLQLGKLDYFYSPTIVTDIEGNQMKSRVCIKIYPDHSQSFFNQVDLNEFMDKYYLIQERFQNYQYDIEHSELGTVEDDENADDTVTFGIAIKNNWILIGQAHIYTDSIGNLLETQDDFTPLIDSKGNLNGKFVCNLKES